MKVLKSSKNSKELISHAFAGSSLLLMVLMAQPLQLLLLLS